MRNRIEKLSLAVLLIGGICWLGAINVRAIIGFDLLQPGTIEFKQNIHPYVERTVYTLIGQSSFVVNVAYIAVWIAGVVFLRTTALRCRQHGWLMMSALLFFIFTPVEVYTMVLDTKLWYLDFIGSNDLVEFRKLFIHRLAALSGVPMIALLSYYTIAMLIAFRPMVRPESPLAAR